jgi:hypothetical protein
LLTLASLILALTFSGTAATARKKHHATSSSTASKSSKHTTKTTRQSAKARHGKASSKKKAQSWRTRQLAPTPDRYKQIQEALVAKGYLQEQPNGRWDTQSSDALRRFQQDQNLDPSGKVNSLSLIALGLGPKRTPVPPSIPLSTAPPVNPAPATPSDPNGQTP